MHYLAYHITSKCWNHRSCFWTLFLTFKYLYERMFQKTKIVHNSRKFKIIYLHTCTVQNSKIVNIDKIFAPQSQIKCVAEASSPDFDLLVMAKTRSAVLGDLVMYSLGRFLCRPGTQRRWEELDVYKNSSQSPLIASRIEQSTQFFFSFLKHYYSTSKNRTSSVIILQMWSVQPKIIGRKSCEIDITRKISWKRNKDVQWPRW